MYRRPLTLVTALLVAAVASACTEKIEGGGACPLLCPQEEITFADTTLYPVVLDTTVAGFPSIGQENYLLLANRGDTLNTRVIIRFDGLPTSFHDAETSADSAITSVDSATLLARILVPAVKPTEPFTINVYNVDTTGVDTVAAGLLPLFRPDRLLGSATFDSTTLDDTLRLPISNAFLLQKISEAGRVRVGLELVGAGLPQLRLLSANVSASATLRFRASADTGVAPLTVNPSSTTPDAPGFLKVGLTDYVVLANSGTPPDPQLLAIGGFPARRTFMRLDIPQRLLDSTTIVRATLILTQAPNPDSPAADEALTLAAVPVLASNAITDITRALTFAADVTVDTLRTKPSSAGEHEFEIVQLVRSWGQTDPEQAPRTIALRLPISTEGDVSGTVLFYSSEAAQSLRPRLKITYVPLVKFDLP